MKWPSSGVSHWNYSKIEFSVKVEIKFRFPQCKSVPHCYAVVRVAAVEHRSKW